MELFRKVKNKQGLPLRQQAEDASAHIAFLMAEADKAVASILHGEHRQRRAGAGEKFWQFREYHPGDRPQDIDWRQSGKTDRIFIRQKEWQTNQSAVLWCSRAESMEFTSDKNQMTKSESAKIITLAISLLLTHAGEQVGLLGTHRKGRSDGILHSIAETLLDDELSPRSLPEEDVPRNSAVYLCGDFLDPTDQIKSRFQNLAAQSDLGVVVQILDPAEIDLPYDGRVVFEKPQDHQRELVNNVNSIRDQYHQRITAHIDEIKNICRACEWHHVLHVTNRDIKDTLLEIWTTLSLHNSRGGVLLR